MIHNQSFYKRLIKCSPNYNLLKIFGCDCLVRLQSHEYNKLEHKNILKAIRALIISSSCPDVFGEKLLLHLSTRLITSYPLGFIISPFINLLLGALLTITRLKFLVMIVLFVHSLMSIIS